MEHTPERRQSLGINIAVLRNDRCNPLRVPGCEPEAHGRTVILDVDGVLLQAQRLRELFDDVGKAVERVRERCNVGRVAATKARVIRCDQVVLVSQFGEEVAKHERGRGKAVQQKQGGLIRRPGFAVEDTEAVDGNGFVGDLRTGHGFFLWLPEQRVH